MAGEVESPAAIEAADELFYRGLNPYHFDQGEVLSTAVVLKKKHTIEQGPSVGIASLIPLTNFHGLISELKGTDWGVCSFGLQVLKLLTLRAHPVPEPLWREYENAHAVVTGYQMFSNKDIGNAERQLRDALQKSILVAPQKPTQVG